jgi:hypothetical protein
MSTNIVILQLAVLGVVLESDLGRRKISGFRILRPVIAIVLIVPFFFTSLPTGHHDLILQGAGLALGALIGLFSVSSALVSVSYDPNFRGHFARRGSAGTPAEVSHAGTGYAMVWILMSAARLAFAYGSTHWFGHGLGHFLDVHDLSAIALTNALIFLSVAMDLFRSIGLAARGKAARRAAYDRFAVLAA